MPAKLDAGAASQCPQELVDCIIDELSDSKADLFSCSLVSRSWLQRARKHLFRSISWHLQQSSTGGCLINDSVPPPHQNLVQELYIDFSDSKSQLVGELLRKSSFTELRRLTLVNASFLVSEADSSANTLSPFLERNRDLEHVGLVRVIYTHLDHLLPTHHSRIKSLVLHSLEGEETEVELGAHPRVVLESLNVFDVDPETTEVLFLRPGSPFDLSHLKTLCLCDDGHDELLKSASHSLKALSLFPPSRRHLSLVNPNLLPNLTHLTIGANDFKYDAMPAILTHLCSLSASATPFLHLETMTLTITVEPGYPQITEKHDGSVVKLLQSAAAVAPSLSRMLLMFHCRSSDEILEVKKDGIVDFLPSERENTLIHVSLS